MPPAAQNAAHQSGIATNGTWLNLSLSQSLSSNWTGGGQDYVALNSSVRASHGMAFDSARVTLNLNLRFGATYVDDTASDEPLRIADNDAFAEVVAAYSLSWKMNPFAAFSARTPITESFQRNGRVKTRSASFWDPVTTSQSVGFSCEDRWLSQWVSTRLGLSVVEIRANRHRATTNDPKTPELDGFRMQTGIESISEASLKLDSSVSYTGRFGLFGTFDDLEVWSVRSENQFRILLWKSLGLLVDVVIVHDVRQSKRTQVRQTLSFGVLHKF